MQVHTTDCSILCKSRIDPNTIIALAWDDHVTGEYWVEIAVEVANERGVLASLATAFSEADSNIADIHIDPKDGRHNYLIFTASVKDRTHLAKIMRKLRSIKNVMRLSRKLRG
jgi:guanosine-3',5'-bis(diphosphate) 3'-pyrophosphohydrolase